ncbi:small ribosomal subunit protein eS27-like, partial [Pezoporus occidentalis]|uniref:small ribosomal subunit protein eS27-like n=1 Tax=Pezoporus occidentalis TaxID=407982 RepID=UPI002F90F42A
LSVLIPLSPPVDPGLYPAVPAGCYKITTVFSHAQTVVLCVGCSTVLCQPTGGKARLTEGCSFRRKQH